MRIVLFCENKYAVDILLPIYQEAVKSEANHILWYVHLPKIPVFPLDGKVVYTHSMQEVYDFSPEAIFVPGNIVPYYLSVAILTPISPKALFLRKSLRNWQPNIKILRSWRPAGPSRIG